MLWLPSQGGGRSLVVDLNRDGHPDVVICNQSGLYTEQTEAYIYWSGDPERRTVLPTLEASGVAAGDFNGDGFIDLAFSNEGLLGAGRFGYDNHRESYVYWNGPLGFSTEHRTALPSVSARDCAAGDLNGDGIADLILLNGNPAERSLYVYYGSKKGFDVTRRERRAVGESLGVSLADLDRDGKPELVLLGADNQARIFHGLAREALALLLALASEQIVLIWAGVEIYAWLAWLERDTPRDWASRLGQSLGVGDGNDAPGGHHPSIHADRP